MRSLRIVALCFINTIACTDSPAETSASASTSTSSGETPTTAAPTTAAPTTGTTTPGTTTSSASDSVTGSSGAVTTSTSSSSSTGGDTSSGTGTSSGDTSVLPACDGAGASNLEGVCIVFAAQQQSFTLAEAKAGVAFTYEVLVLADLANITTEAINTCDQPGPGGLFVGERVEGNGQSYCLCDQGKCANPMEPPFVLKAGAYPDSLPWDGVNWSGPSDFNNPKGPPFPPGMYAVKIRAIGQHDGQPFEVTGELPITLKP